MPLAEAAKENAAPTTDGINVCATPNTHTWTHTLTQNENLYVYGRTVYSNGWNITVRRTC